MQRKQRAGARFLYSGSNKLRAEKRPRYVPYLFPLYIGLGCGYLIWRSFFGIEWSSWFSILLLFNELLTVVATILFLFTTRRFFQPVWQPPLKGKIVDILIPTMNEPLEVLELTITGAMQTRGVCSR